MKETWIYESPDKGKTVYKRPFMKDSPRILINNEKEKT
jgi:hypothetical protein